MTDYIYIENLEIYANHGVMKEETVLGQKFLVSAKLFFDVRVPAANDDIDSTVNYAGVCEHITRYFKDNTCKLIETVADRIARELLIKYPLLDKVEVTVKKPWAPIGLPIENVSVSVTGKWHDVYLSIGSNMGDRDENLKYVYEYIEKSDSFRNCIMSTVIETKPYGGVEQDDFLNAVIKVQTLCSPYELLDIAHNLENDRNRVRQIHWGPRTLDVDIVFYDDSVINRDNLIIPHPDMENREFVLAPMVELNPYFIHPVKRESMKCLYEKLVADTKESE